MGIAELKNQFMNYVFSDNDPKKTAERYIELCKYANLVKVTPAAATAFGAISTEMTKSDTPEHRARLCALIETVNERRLRSYEKAIQGFQEDPGIITEPFYSIEGEALNYIGEDVLFLIGNPELKTGEPEDEADLNRERWRLLCEENGLPLFD